MRKNYTPAKWIVMLLLLAFTSSSHSQVNLYNFSQSTGTYTEITGGTVLFSSSWDDNQQNNVNIGFTFNFNGTDYTTLRIASNGFLVLGTSVTPGTANYTPLSGTNAYPAAIAALGGDLIAAASGSEMRYQTIGSAPNQTFVLQWKKAARINTSYLPTTGDDLNFQIRLNQTTNTISIAYGSFTVTNSSASMQVGLRGATNADFNNRATSTNWAATVLGTANTATSVVGVGVVPSSGLTFTYTPPTPCSAAFAGGTTVSSVDGYACAGGGFTLSVANATNATGFTYQWQTSTDGVTWTSASGTSTGTTYAVTGFAATTYYRRKMSCSGSDQYSTTQQVSPTPALTYAPLPYTQGFENWITTCNGTTGYASAIPGPEWKNTLLTTDSSWRRNDQGFTTAGWRYVNDDPAPYPAPYASAGNYSARFHTYGSTGTNRGTMMLYLNCTGATSPLQLSFDYRNPTGQDSLVVAVSTDNGTTFTRVDYLGTSSAWSNKTFVFNSSSAQTVVRLQAFSDYGNDDIGVDNLKVQVAPSCLTPTGLAISAITATTASFSWNSVSGAANYEVAVSTSATPPAGAGTSTSGATSYGFTGLVTNTTYFAFVRANCGSGGFGAWVSKQFSTTPNDECTNAITVTQVVNNGTCTGTSVSTAAATQSAQTAPSCSSGFGYEDDVWYKFVATKTTAIIRISNLVALSGTATDIGSTVYSGACGSLAELSCTAGSDIVLTGDRTVTGLTVGGTYYIRVYAGGVSNNAASFNMCVLEPPAPPANDNCSAAIALTYGYGPINGTTVSATQSQAAEVCATFTSTTANDVWYKFTATANGGASVAVTNSAASFDPVIQCYSGTCATLVNIGCADATTTGGNETATLTALVAGQTYYVRVYTYSTGADGTFTIGVSGSALPVSLINFRGERQGSINLLSWTTVSETNNKGFEIQRSADGSNFSAMAFVESKAPNGNSANAITYTLNDTKPFASTAAYYRLKQMDKDGKSSFSPIVMVKGTKPSKLELASVYPNPVVEQLNIIMASPKTDKVTLIISDLAGKIVMSQPVQVANGDNAVQLKVGALAKGTYTIKAICADGCETAISKFVKQ